MIDRKDIADRLREAASQIEAHDDPVTVRRIALRASIEALNFVDEVNAAHPEQWDVVPEVGAA